MEKEKKNRTILSLDKGTRTLTLPESIDEEFNEIKEFGCYAKFYGRTFFHSFYSLAIAYATTEIEPEELKDYFHSGESYDKNPKNETMKNAIDSPQLAHHDILFKIIAYWYALKNNDDLCYRYIIETNEARKFCEELFFRYYKSFLEKLKKLSSEIPNINLLEDLD